MDDVQAIDKELEREQRRDWDAVWIEITEILARAGSSWRTAEQKLFRSVFTHKDPAADAVSTGSRRTADYEPDPDLRDFENVPLEEDIDAFFNREVKPHVADAWPDRTKDKVGHEINFNRHFYAFQPARPLEQIDAELKEAEEQIVRLLKEITA